MGNKSQDANFDGVQFHHNRYQYQPNYAFIKGYTLLISGVKLVVKFIHENLSELIDNDFNAISTIMKIDQLIELVILVLVNKILFSLTAYKVYNIIMHLNSNNHKIANCITLLYLYNPACVFFHAIYTQSIYAFLTFTSIQYLLKSQNQQVNNNQSNQQQVHTQINKNYVKSFFFLWTAVFFRTNAVFLSPIFGLTLIYQLWLQIQHRNFISIAKTIIKGTLILALILSPLIYYQFYIYHQLCNSQIDLKNDQKLVNQCSKLLPNLYGFIQHKFWNVGFFCYWKLSNIVFISLGIPALLVGSIIVKQIFIMLKSMSNKIITNLQLTKMGLYLSFLLLFIVTLTLTNIQSSTRFFSTHIIFYLLIYKWFPYKMIAFWIFLYYSFGVILFFIGFPWT